MIDPLDRLIAIVGRRWVLTGAEATRSYRTGYRVGGGEVHAVARPGTLVELWCLVEECVKARAIVILQAANTGLTGGSTPHGTYDRPVVVISTSRIKGVMRLSDSTDVVCMAGSTLTELEATIAPYGREPHSVIGSSCIGASVVGGICNSSGGALVRRGPAFTAKALYGRVTADGRLELVNRLGVSLPEDPVTALAMLDGNYTALSSQLGEETFDDRKPYESHVRAIEEPTPSRFNADPRGLFEASGSAGKLVVFAVRVPTFRRPGKVATFLVGTNDPDDFTRLRQALLAPAAPLPILCEYIHREAVWLAVSHAADVCLALRTLGEGRMPTLISAQGRFDSIGRRLGFTLPLSATVGKALGRIGPHPLSRALQRHFERFEHSLLIKADDDGIERAEAILAAYRSGHGRTARRLSEAEAGAAYRVRFAVAAATARYAEVEPAAGPLVALDLALPRNARDWNIALPPELADQVAVRAGYGHFLCHVFHLDFVLRPGNDGTEFERAVKSLVEGWGGQMPAEHNFGHVYPAPGSVAEFYRQLDPTNTFNPGIGMTSKKADWR